MHNVGTEVGWAYTSWAYNTYSTVIISSPNSQLYSPPAPILFITSLIYPWPYFGRLSSVEAQVIPNYWCVIIPFLAEIVLAFFIDRL